MIRNHWGVLAGVVFTFVAGCGGADGPGPNDGVERPPAAPATQLEGIEGSGRSATAQGIQGTGHGATAQGIQGSGHAPTTQGIQGTGR